MSSPVGSVRQRGQKDKKKATTSASDDKTNGTHDVLANAKQQVQQAVTREWDYKLALGIITVLAFITRFWGISHPNQVVFDEVHFGKVSMQSRGRKWPYN